MKDCSAAILCGGRSRRMGFDKSLLIVNGQFVLGVLAEELAARFGEVMLVVDDCVKLESIPALKKFCIIEDIYPSCGPVGGIATALAKSEAERVFVMGCDMPVIDLAFIGRMRAVMMQRNSDVALPCHDRFLEPLYAFYAKSCLSVFQHSIVEQKLAVRQSFDQLQVVRCDVTAYGADPHIFANLNYPEDLQDIAQYFEKDRGGECLG